MSPQILFLMHLVLGYVACLLCFSVYFLPKFQSMEPIEAQRVIATVHSFRFFGLVFILPGVVGPNLPAGFASFVTASERPLPPASCGRDERDKGLHCNPSG
jgi:hypothetical protein